MTKKASIARYNLIIRKLRNAPASFKEVADFLNRHSSIDEYDFNICKRTFQRDIIDISELYHIHIGYNFSDRRYYIDKSIEPGFNERLLHAFDTFNALNMADRLSAYIFTDYHYSRGTENLYDLLHAIQHKVRVSFRYSKYYDDEITDRETEPYALREFKNRWYLFCRDLNDGRFKIFGLDRMTEVEVSRNNFIPDDNINLKEYYNHCFGIMVPNEQNPVEVILSFDPVQGNYIKSLPLHHSQQILEDNEEELRISLKIFITRDFIMELLSYGDSVEVIEPHELVEEIKAILEQSLNQYR